MKNGSAAALHALLSKVRVVGNDNRVVIKAGRILTGTPLGTLESHAVIIDDGVIERIVPWESCDVGADDEVVDALQWTLMPGMIDAHCHVTGEWAHAPHDTYMEPFPETRVLRALQDVWAVYASGYTTLVSMGHGHPNHVGAIRTAITEDGLVGPRIYHCGWAISPSAGHGHVRDWNYELVKVLRPRSAFADGPWELRRLVRENVGTGADFIKVYAGEGGYTAPSYISRRLDFSPEELLAVTDEAHRLGFQVAAHCMTLEHVKHALENGVDRIEHGPCVYEEDFVPLLKEYGAAWCPTLSQLHWGLEERHQRGLSAEQVTNIQRALDARCEMIEQAMASGVTVGFGTDNRMRPKAGQQSIELRLMVERGIAPETALEIATRGAADISGLDADLGSVSPGKLADLILVDGDPTSDINVLLNPANIKLIIKSHRKAHVTAPRRHNRG